MFLGNERYEGRLYRALKKEYSWESLSDSRDVFNHLVEPQENWMGSILAFAIAEEARFECMVHQKKATGSIPTDEEIRKWYAQQPESNMIRAKTDANIALANFMEEAIDSAIKADQDGFRKSEIIAEINKVKNEVAHEVTKLGKIWLQSWKNMIFSLLGYGVFTIITLMAIICLKDLSILDLIELIFREG